jgi:hypothetical protein
MTKQKKTEVLIDDCFYIKKQRWGTFVSVHKDGNALITSLTEDQCVSATRWYLKAQQDGFPDDSKSYDGVVGGKL